MQFSFPSAKNKTTTKDFFLRGFTLVELMVTMAIFTSVITIATGALFSAQAVNTKLQETQTILDEVTLSIEVMSRDIRYGSSFYCTNNPTDQAGLALSARRDCPYPTGYGAVMFKPAMGLRTTTDQTKDRVVYYLSAGVLYKTEYPYGSSPVTYQMTSQDIHIDTLSFYVYGSATDADQPVVTISISGTTIPSRKNVQPIPFSVQLSVSERGIDN
jgi:prepilin-type N-terminal cleavage/methylation domain-containing protein